MWSYALNEEEQVKIIVLSATNLEAIIKGRSHLARKIIGVNIQNGQNIILDLCI